MEYCEKAEVSPFSHPPDIKHQEDVLSTFNKNLSMERFLFLIKSTKNYL
jgi:hypothetical protein